MTDFQSFGLSETLMTSLERMGFTSPTPIQEKAIPLALNGRDILGSAQTGTGKTGAFSIPMIEMLLREPSKTALVLTPTRELAKQVLNAMRDMLGPKSGIKTAFIIGGEPYHKQFAQLKSRPRIIVGTPGRINDHLDRGSLDLSACGFLVLDETDRMLDMGFGVQLERIKDHLSDDRQTLLFSATMPNDIVRLSKKYLNNPERVSVGETNVVAPKIKTEIIHIAHDKKHDEMVRQLADRTGSVIIFVKTKYGTEKMAKRLREDGFTADALHGDLRQRKRDKVMQSFRNKKFRILVATDIAARGLDVPHIEHVINHDLPQVAEDYIHRMGRTARAGADGSALCFISPADRKKWAEIEKLLGMKSNDNRPQRKKSNGKKPFTSKKTSGGKKPDWKKSKPTHKDGSKKTETSESGNNRKKKSFDGKKAFSKKDGAKPNPKGKSGSHKPFKRSDFRKRKKAA